MCTYKCAVSGEDFLPSVAEMVTFQYGDFAALNGNQQCVEYYAIFDLLIEDDESFSVIISDVSPLVSLSTAYTEISIQNINGKNSNFVQTTYLSKIELMCRRVRMHSLIPSFVIFVHCRCQCVHQFTTTVI